MKLIIKILMLFVLLQSFQCTDTNETIKDISKEELQTKKEEIQNYINSFSCSETLGCGYIAFGSKPCGGPTSYLLFSKAVDIVQLEQMVKNYNEMEELFNKQTNAISDCMYLSPPNEVKCINGVCTIVK
jgi:hypothetical protein